MPEALLRALELSISRRVEGLLPGDHRSMLLGRGSELAQIRPYQPAEDDVRQIDWNVTARTGTTHVRVQLAERALVTWLVLDTSPSMSFGTAERRKADVAEGASLAVGYAATRRGNRLGLVTFGDANPRTLPARQGRQGLLGLLLALRKEEAARDRRAEDGAASIGAGLRRAANLARQRAYVVVISDFRGDRDWRRPLLMLSGRHQVVAIEIRDPREQELPKFGQLRLVDPETGRQLKVDTSSERLRSQFAAAAAEERRQVASEIASTGARHVVLRDARRLAARPDRLPPSRGRAVSFASPIALLALVLLPVAAAGYLWLERRRMRQTAQFVSSGLLPNVVDHVPGLAQAPAGGDPAARGGELPARLRAAARHALREVRGGHGRARDRHVALDGRARRPADAARGGAGLGADVPGRPAQELPRRRRQLQYARAARIGADDRPQVRGHGISGLRIGEGTALGDGLSTAVAVARGTPRGVKPAKGTTPPPSAILIISDGALDGGHTKLRDAIAQARQAKIPVFTAMIGTQVGVVEVPHIGGYVERIQVPPDPGNLRGIATADRWPLLRRRRPPATSRSSTRISSRASAPPARTRRSRSPSRAPAPCCCSSSGVLSVLWFRRVP